MSEESKAELFEEAIFGFAHVWQCEEVAIRVYGFDEVWSILNGP